MKKKTYYKVVSCHDGKFKSAVVYEPNLLFFPLEYSIGKTTVPNMGRIFIFKDIETAKDFASMRKLLGHYNVAIFEGYATDIGKPTHLADKISYFHLRIFWDHKKAKRKVRSFPAPQGTLSCSSFTPIKFV